MKFTKQDLARGKVIVMAMAFGTLLLLANQAQAALLFWEDNAELADKPAGDWADLALPGTTSDGAMGSWYGGSFDTQTGLSFGMDEHGLDYGRIDKPTPYSQSGGLVDPVPEPASLMLLGGGLLALAAGRARRKNS